MNYTTLKQTPLNLKPWTILLIMLVIVSLPLFARLDQIPLKLWDESRLCVNAFEMSQSGNWIVTTIDGQPDLRSPKPPFMIWMQVISFKLFGFNELAGRLPAPVAAALTCIFIFWLFARRFKEPMIGFISCIVLVTSPGFVNLHGARSADYDTFLTLFTTAYCCFFFLYAEYKTLKYLYCFFASLVLAALTKEIAAMFLLPGLLLYAIFSKNLLYILKQKEFYIGIAAFIFFVGGYYLLREHMAPGYLREVWKYEVVDRFNTPLSNQGGPFYYYLDCILKFQFDEWYLFILPGAAIGLLSKNNLLKKLTLFSICIIVTHLLVISGAATKFWWYDMPLFPFLSIIVAVFLHTIFSLLISLPGLKEMMRFNCLPYIFLFLIFVIPYKKILDETLWGPPTRDSWRDEYSDMTQLLKYVLHGQRNIDGAVVPDCWPQNLLWYSEVLTYQKRPIKFIRDLNFGNAKKIVAYNQETKNYIESHYNTHIIQTYASVIEYYIDSVKDDIK